MKHLLFVALALAAGPLAAPGLHAQDFHVWQKKAGASVDLSTPGALTFQLPSPGIAIAGRPLAITAQPGERIHLRVMVEKSDLKDASGATSNNHELNNEGGAGLCLALTQNGADGKPLAITFSQESLSVDTPTELTLETFVYTGAVSFTAAIRAVNVSGTAMVDGFQSQALPALPDPVFSRSWVQRNAQGVPQWYLCGQAKPLDLYFGNNLFGHDDRLLSELMKAVPAGVSCQSFDLMLPGSSSDEDILATLDRFLSKTGDTPWMARVWLGPPPGWFGSHPQEQMHYEDGTTEPFASPSSEAWRKVTAENLDHLLRLIGSSPYAKRLAGIIPLYYQTGEWVLWDPDKQAGFDSPTRAAYQAWLQAKYATLDALNTAWGASETDWNAAARPPTAAERKRGSFGLLRTAADQRAIDWSAFYTTTVPAAIDAAGAAIKKTSGGNILVGVFYGYTVEMAAKPYWPQQSSHLGVADLLASPNVDFLGSPYSYQLTSRAFNLPMNIMAEPDSVVMHGKLYFQEEDTFTHLAQKPDPKLMAPGYPQRTHNLDETLGVLMRDLGTCISHGLILHWDSLLSDGRFDAPEIWQRYGAIFPWMQQWQNDRGPYAPQVACVIDEKAYTGLSIDSEAYFRRWIYGQRSCLNRIGVPMGLYLQSDLAQIPPSVRVLIFPTSFALTSAQMDELKKDWLKDGRMAIFCWLPPGAAAAHDGDTVSSIPGLPVTLHGAPINPGSKVTGDLWSDHAGQLISPTNDSDREKPAPLPPVSPYGTVAGSVDHPLAEYTANNAVSCAWQPGDGFSTVFMGAQVNLPQLWRELLEKAAVHFYLDPTSDDWNASDYIQGSGPFLMIQSGRDGSRTITWPQSCSQILHWDGATWQPAATQSSTLDWTFKRGIPEFFLTK
jgi:hypothetical protein